MEGASRAVRLRPGCDRTPIPMNVAKSIGALASQMGGQLLCLGGNNHEVLGVEWIVVVCWPLRPRRPCLKSLCNTPVSHTSTSARSAACGATEAPLCTHTGATTRVLGAFLNALFHSDHFESTQVEVNLLLPFATDEKIAGHISKHTNELCKQDLKKKNQNLWVDSACLEMEGKV